jgi:hypothetical protein
VIGPSIVLAAIFALFHVSLYVLIRGRTGASVLLLLVAAFLGAWAGDALGARLGLAVLTIGDFHVIPASILAWVGIGVVALVAILAADRPSEAGTS